MTMITALAMFGPIALVFGMQIIPAFDGWKTRTQGTILTVIGLIQQADLTFIPDDIAKAVVLGAGISTIIGYQLSGKPRPGGE